MSVGNVSIVTSENDFVNNYITRYDIGATAIYIGHAVSGAATSAAKWYIKKITLSSGNPTASERVGGIIKFDQIWDNRASLSYS